jgi:hypothetical protein
MAWTRRAERTSDPSGDESGALRFACDSTGFPPRFFAIPACELADLCGADLQWPIGSTNSEKLIRDQYD